MDYARNPPRFPPGTGIRSGSRSHESVLAIRPANRTIGATMQPAPSTPFTPPHVPALRLRGEKPHQGVRSKNPAPYRGHRRCNLRTALGLREGQHKNRVRSRCSGEQYDSDLGLYYLRARYYNPATGRFLSRDPEDGIPTDPATLHKYVYASGDPVNLADPSGRATIAPPLPATRVSAGPLEYGLIVSTISLASTTYLAATACAINIAYTMEALRVAGDTEVTPDLRHCSAKGKSCKSPPYTRYIPINQLWYQFENKYAALQEAIASNGGKQPRYGTEAKAKRGPCGSETSSYVPGTHQNLLLGGQHVGDIVSCEACDDSSGDPELITLWDYVPPSE
jgi:RHS repeat-associated protein